MGKGSEEQQHNEEGKERVQKNKILKQGNKEREKGSGKVRET